MLLILILYVKCLFTTWKIMFEIKKLCCNQSNCANVNEYLLFSFVIVERRKRWANRRSLEKVDRGVTCTCCTIRWKTKRHFVICLRDKCYVKVLLHTWLSSDLNIFFFFYNRRKNFKRRVVPYTRTCNGN